MTKTKEKIIDTAYILGDGRCYGVGEMKKLTAVQDTGGGSASIDKDVADSKQLKDVGFDYDKDDIIQPPFNLNNLIDLINNNTEHARCVKAKAADTLGRGWAIVENEKVKKTERKENDKQILEDFFENCNDDYPFEEMIRRVLEDLEAAGNGYIEVGRNLKGLPAKMWHADTSTVRVKINHTGFLQLKDQKKVHFQNFGEKVVFDENSHKIKARNFIDPADGKEKQSLGMLKSANEMIQFKNYLIGNAYYGAPDIIPAMRAILGNTNVAKYNNQFFDHNAIPQYVVIIRGARLSQELRELIELYFRTEIKGEAHKTLIMPVPYKDVEIEFKSLAVDTKDQSFGEYRKANRDEILLAHGVQPAVIGIIETANLGAGSGYSQAEQYKRSVIERRQLIIETKFDRLIIKKGFGIQGWKFKFLDIDLRDQEKESEIARRYLEKGALTINEVRTEFLGRKKYETGGDRAFIIVGNEIVFIDELGVSEQKDVEYLKILKDYNEIKKELEALRG